MELFKYEGTVLVKIIYKKTIPIQSEFIYPQYARSNFKQVDADNLSEELYESVKFYYLENNSF